MLDSAYSAATSLLLLLVGPMVLSWAVARFAGTRLTPIPACGAAIFAASILWGFGVSAWISWDIVANGADPIAGFGTLLAPPIAAIGATLGAFIAAWPHRAAFSMKRLFLVLLSSGVAAALVSVAAAYGLFVLVLSQIQP